MLFVGIRVVVLVSISISGSFEYPINVIYHVEKHVYFLMNSFVDEHRDARVYDLPFISRYTVPESINE